MRRQTILSALAVPLLLACPATALAQSEVAAAEPETPAMLVQRAQDVVAVMQGEKPMSEVFTPSFIAAVSPAQFAALTTQLTGQHGQITGLGSVTPVGQTGAQIEIRFERAVAIAGMQLDSAPPQKIAGLRLTDIQPLDDNVEKIRAELSALPGDVSVYFGPLDRSAAPTLSLYPERQMAIGSTFKLYILSALARSIENGERAWSDVVPLSRRSFPSGTLQTWPENAPVTLHTLATLMISISDNTATDILLHTVGRSAVEAELIASGHSDPARTLPLLSTLEMFALKGSPVNLNKYIAADEEQRRLILTDFEDDIGGDPTLITPPRFTQPTAIDTVEWFANADDLRGLLLRITQLNDPAAREIMAVSPSLTPSNLAAWQYAGFKGGSEPGVLNATWLLQDDAGAWHMLAMSWNNTEAPVDQATFEGLSQRIIALAN